MDEIKSVRVRRNDINSGSLDIRVVIFKQNHTFGAEERVVAGIYNPYKPDAKKVWIETTYKKTGSYKDYTDDQFIEDFVNMNSKIEGKLYYVIQDPWENKVPIYRDYGSDPYYLNNGSVVYIMWKDGDKVVGGQKYSDDNGHELTPNDITFKKTIKIISSNETQGFTLGKNGDFEYSNNSQEYVSTIKDSDIISEIISKWKTKVDNYNDLWPCMPIYESCSIIPYKGPLQPIVPEVSTKPVGATAANAESTSSKEKIKVVVQDQIIKVKEDVTSLKVFIGILKDTPVEPPLEEQTLNTEQDDFIDGEGVDISDYVESDFVGEEEAPIDLPDVDPAASSIQETSSENTYTPPMVVSGKVVSLPTTYSHTSTQGFNLLNSQWIGDLITSAISHIGHPTYDIAGTESPKTGKKGALGCASAVSMIFYRAFGVNMRTGSAVKSIPKSIGDFGSKGTAELAGWFLNGNLYRKLNWQDAQPGDILNTAKASESGHIGVVINTKNNDGSWNVVSNSSEGFSGGGGGAIKQNYSVKKWQDVANRNPSGTFAYRYIGPKLSSGHTA
jgi:hypothetical protein